LARGHADAADLTFETSLARLVIRSNGVAASLRDKQTGKERLLPDLKAFSAVKKRGQVFPASEVEQRGDLLHMKFGASAVDAEYRVTVRPEYIVVELTAISGDGVEEVWLAQFSTQSSHSGETLAVQWDDEFALCLLALSERVESRADSHYAQASVHPEYGMLGERIAIVAVPTSQLLDQIRKVEQDFHIPSASIGGQWAKHSDAVNTSYLFVDLTEANADKMIAYAKQAGLGYILVYSDTWSSSAGSYPVNLKNFPRGEASLKNVIERCHAAGLKVGMHMMTSAVAKNDPLAGPRPDPRLLKDAEATLAVDLSARATAVEAGSALADFPREGVYSGNKGGLEIVIDDEIIHYAAIEGTKFVGCTRGFAGTVPAAHQARAKIQHLAERFGNYVADLRTSLKEAIADRVAGVINRCGFDMIYFDGSEAAIANGPFWYWAGLEPSAIWARSKRELLVQGSGMTQWTWHIYGRGTCDDYSAVAVKQYLDHHKIAVLRPYYRNNFVPAELGWWGFLARAPDHHATTPDEAEYYGVRMLSLNMPIGLETSLAVLQANGRTDEMLSILGRYERLRRSGGPGDALRGELATGEWHMSEQGRFEPIRYDTQRAQLDGQITVRNEFAAQPLKFRVQMTAPPKHADHSSSGILLKGERPIELEAPNPGAVMPGVLIRRIDFTKRAPAEPGVFVARRTVRASYDAPLRLGSRHAVAVRLEVDGASSRADEQAILDVQFESSDGIYRDYYIELNFTGSKTVVLPEPSPERTLVELRPPMQNFYYKSSLQQFNYNGLIAVNLRWARFPKAQGPKCRISLIEALADRRGKLKKLQVLAGGASIRIPGKLSAGDYVEFWADGWVRIFNGNGMLLRKEVTKDSIWLAKGQNNVSIRGAGSGNLMFTTITFGPEQKDRVLAPAQELL